MVRVELKKQFDKILFVLILIILLILPACSIQSYKLSNNNIKIKDQINRDVSCNIPVNRISSAYYISTTTLIALGQKNKLVCVEDKVDSRPIYQICNANINNLPNTGSNKELNLETCLSQHPDIVFLSKSLKDFTKKLDEVNLPAFVLVPEDISSLIQMIEICGKVCGCDDTANKLVNHINAQFENIEKTYKNENSPNVYLASNSSILRGASGSSFQNEIINKTNCINILKGEKSDDVWIQTDYENILNKNPDYIILPSNATYSVNDVLNDVNLESCSAVQNKQVFKMPGNIEAWDSPVPSSFIGGYWLAEVTHPNKKSQSEYKNKAQEFYKDFYNVDISEYLE